MVGNIKSYKNQYILALLIGAKPSKGGLQADNAIIYNHYTQIGISQIRIAFSARILYACHQ